MHGTVVFVFLICLSGAHFAPIKIGMKDFDKWLIQLLVGENTIKIGSVALDLTEMNFESSFLEVYNGVIDFIDGHLRPASHFRLIFNKNIITCISDVIFPARYNAFLADAVEGNTILYRLQCLIQRRIYMDSSFDNSETLRCWRKLDSVIYIINSESQYFHEVEDRGLGDSCEQFFSKLYPDVSWNSLPAWETSLNPSQFLQKRRLFQINDERLHRNPRNFEDGALKFYACSHEKINLVQDVSMRFCYQKTLDINMHLFLGQFLWKFTTEYEKLKDLFIKLAAIVPHVGQEYEMSFKMSTKHQSLLNTEISLGSTTLLEGEGHKARVKKESNSISIIETLDESIAYQRKAIIFVGVIIFIGCVILAVIITKIILCCKDFRAFYQPAPKPLVQDFKTIEKNLKKGKSNLRFMKTRQPPKGRKKTTHAMKSMSDVTLPVVNDLAPLPDENDPLIRTSFNNPSKPATPKKKK